MNSDDRNATNEVENNEEDLLTSLGIGKSIKILPLPVSTNSLHTIIAPRRIGHLRIPTTGVDITLSIETLLESNKKKQQQNPRKRNYILVGRQASIADIRIQHASISRKHALFYYTTTTTTTTTDTTTASLTSQQQEQQQEQQEQEIVVVVAIRDLGSKYGITINGTKLQSNTSQILYENDTIQFGNVRESIFTVQCTTQETNNNNNNNNNNNATTENIRTEEGTEQVKEQQSTDEIQPTKEDIDQGHEDNNNSNNNSEGVVVVTNNTATATKSLVLRDQEILESAGRGLSGRDKRQAEIAAMMASFDTTPVYTTTIHQTTDDDSNDVISSTNPKRKIDNNIHQESSTADDDNDPITQLIRQYELPVTEQYVLPSESEASNVTKSRIGGNSITCLSYDKSGSKVVVGSTDSSIRIYDFGTLNSLYPQSTSSFIPEDGHWPIDCSYNTIGTDSKLLVGTTSSQPTVVTAPFNSSSSTNALKFVRGDMYVLDPMKTVGHVASITAVDWHPYQSSIVVTASIDGSVRFWNIVHGKKQFDMLTSSMVYVVKNHRGQKTVVTSLQFHPNGQNVIIGTHCGSIQIWKFNASIISSSTHTKNKSTLNTVTRPDRVIYDAHPIVHSIHYNYTGTQIVSRYNPNDNTNNNNNNSSDTIKVWDPKTLSKSSEPLYICQPKNVGTVYERSSCTFSPNGKFLLVPSTTDATSGSINIFHLQEDNTQKSSSRTTTFIRPIIVLPITSSVPILIKWHPKSNQIYIGCSNGDTIILYDPTYSTKGILVAVSKSSSYFDRPVDALTELLQSRAPPPGVAEASRGEIIAPNYRDPEILASKRRKKDEWKLEITGDTTTKSKKTPSSLEPERPAAYRHKMSTGQTAGIATTFQQFVADQQQHSSTTQQHKQKQVAGIDPREALFQYHDPSNKTNNNRLADKPLEQDEEEQGNG